MDSSRPYPYPLPLVIVLSSHTHNNSAHKVIHEYDNEKNLFKCLLGAEPPGIYKRALISESGLIPYIEENYKIFKNVSERNALLLMSKLYN